MMTDHPHTLLDCLKHLTLLAVKGDLAEHWKADPDCIKHCIKTIVCAAMDAWAPDGPIGSNPFSGAEIEAMQELLAACDCPCPAGAEGEPAGALVDLLLPLLIKMVLKWLEKQS